MGCSVAVRGWRERGLALRRGRSRYGVWVKLWVWCSERVARKGCRYAVCANRGEEGQ